ncbi:uncharacterized protein FFB14_12632 [Fusarium fujikuroi]|nr:uncharacterized protein FFB14_12632 [Fusarium fujikuroi]
MCHIVNVAFRCCRCRCVTRSKQDYARCAQNPDPTQPLCPPSNCTSSNVSRPVFWMECDACSREYQAWYTAQQAGFYYEPDPPFEMINI